MKPIDGAALRAVRADDWYPLSAVARMLGRSPETVADWCRGTGPRLASEPDPFDARRRVVSGAVLLAGAGHLLRQAEPLGGDLETEAERRRRCEADLAAIRGMAGGTTTAKARATR